MADEDPAYWLGYLFGQMLCPLSVSVVTIGVIGWAVWYHRRT